MSRVLPPSHLKPRSSSDADLTPMSSTRIQNKGTLASSLSTPGLRASKPDIFSVPSPRLLSPFLQRAYSLLDPVLLTLPRLRLLLPDSSRFTFNTGKSPFLFVSTFAWLGCWPLPSSLRPSATTLPYLHSSCFPQRTPPLRASYFPVTNVCLRSFYTR